MKGTSAGRGRIGDPWIGVLCTAGAVAWMAGVAQAGVTTDGSLPGTSAQVLAGPDYRIPAELGYQLDTSLFHGLGELTLQTGESATFEAPLQPTPIDLVIATITGPDPSNIDGLLRSEMPGADFYLINPNGVVFGENARIDVGGAFTATTADLVRLGGDGLLVSRDPGGIASTLTSSPPSAFGFLGEPAPIAVNGARLLLRPGERFSLVGGDLDMNGARSDGQGGFVSTRGGRIDLVSLGGPGWATPDPAGVPGYALAADVRGAITLSRRAIVSSSGLRPDDLTCGIGCTVYSGAGDVFIRGGELVIDDAQVDAFTVTTADAGDIDVELSGDMVVRGLDAGLFASSGFVANADLPVPPPERVGRNLRTTFISGENVFIQRELLWDTASGGCLPGSCRITYAAGAGGITNPETAIPHGAAGDIRVVANDVHLTEGGELSTTTFALGQAGSIDIRAAGGVLITGDPTAFTGSYDAIRGGLFSNAQGGEDAGQITVVAKGDLVMDRFGAIVTEARGGDGRGGDILVEAANLHVLGNSRIDSSTRGAGDGGAVTVNVTDTISLDGALSADEFSGITSVSQPEATGAAGNLRIEASNLELTNGARISTRSFGGGDAGTIDIRFGDTFSLRDSVVESVAVNAFGGDIYANGGPIRRLANGTLTIEKPADLTTTGGLLLLVDSRISTDVTQGAGDGGNIAIDPDLVVLVRSAISANADVSDGGNIKIVAGLIVIDRNSVIEATSNRSSDGIVEIVGPQSTVINPISPLPQAFLDAAALMRERCALRDAAGSGGSFVVAGRDGMPATPDDYLPAPLPIAAPASEPALAQAVVRDHDSGEPMGVALGCRGRS